MRFSRFLSSLVLVALVGLFSFACSSGDSGSATTGDTAGGDATLADGAATDTDAPLELTVDTIVTPESVAVGAEAEVSCVATDPDGNPVEADFEVTVEPEDGSLEAGVFTSDVAGTYTFTCALKDGSATDESPATLTVEPGEPAEIRTELDPDEVAAGEATTVVCTLLDAMGNEITVSPWIIEAPEGAETNGMSLTITEAGEHEVRCTSAAAGEVTNEPAILTVLPGDPVGIALKATPARDWYNPLSQVTLSYDVVDAHGNAIEDADLGALAVTIDPAEGMEEISDLKYRFNERGVYTVQGSVTGPPAYSDELALICDPEGPVITITAPERGLTLDVPAMVTVTGTAVDEVTGVAELTLNGDVISVEADGSFSADLPLEVGMNLLHVEAVDGVGHTGERIQSVLHSPLWYDMDPESAGGGWVDDSALAFLHPGFFYNRNDADDFTISSFLGLVLEELDIDTLLPNPLMEDKIIGCDEVSTITLDDVRLTVPTQINRGTEAAPDLVSNPILNPIDGGFRLAIVIEDFSAYLTISTPDGGWLCLDTEGRIYADVTVGADLFVSLPASGQPSVDMQHLTVSITNIRLDGLGLVGGVANLLSEFLDGILAGLIEDMINEQVGDLLGDLTDLLVIDEEVELDPFLGEGPAVPLRIQADFDRFEVVGTPPGAGVHVNAALSVTAPKAIEREILGSMGRGHCDAATPEFFAMPMTDDVEIGVFLDAANSALYTLWDAGFLHLDITAETLGDSLDLSQYGILDLAAETRPLLPPVLVDCGDDGALVAQVGDFLLHASFVLFGTPIDATMYVFAEIGASPVIVEGENGQEVGISIDEIRVFQTDIVELNEEGEGSRDMLFSLIEDTAPNIIMSELASEPITFEIPVLDISGLDDSGILPPNILLKIVIDSLEDALGYLKGSAHLEQGIPGVDVPGSCSFGARSATGPAVLLLLLAGLGLATLRRRGERV